MSDHLLSSGQESDSGQSSSNDRMDAWMSYYDLVESKVTWRCGRKGCALRLYSGSDHPTRRQKDLSVSGGRKWRCEGENGSGFDGVCKGMIDHHLGDHGKYFRPKDFGWPLFFLGQVYNDPYENPKAMDRVRQLIDNGFHIWVGQKGEGWYNKDVYPVVISREIIPDHHWAWSYESGIVVRSGDGSQRALIMHPILTSYLSTTEDEVRNRWKILADSIESLFVIGDGGRMTAQDIAAVLVRSHVVPDFSHRVLIDIGIAMKRLGAKKARDQVDVRSVLDDHSDQSSYGDGHEFSPVDRVRDSNGQWVYRGIKPISPGFASSYQSDGRSDDLQYKPTRSNIVLHSDEHVEIRKAWVALSQSDDFSDDYSQSMGYHHIQFVGQVIDRYLASYNSAMRAVNEPATIFPGDSLASAYYGIVPAPMVYKPGLRLSDYASRYCKNMRFDSSVGKYGEIVVASGGNHILGAIVRCFDVDPYSSDGRYTPDKIADYLLMMGEIRFIDHGILTSIGMALRQLGLDKHRRTDMRWEYHGLFPCKSLQSDDNG